MPCALCPGRRLLASCIVKMCFGRVPEFAFCQVAIALIAKLALQHRLDAIIEGARADAERQKPATYWDHAALLRRHERKGCLGSATSACSCS